MSNLRELENEYDAMAGEIKALEEEATIILEALEGTREEIERDGESEFATLTLRRLEAEYEDVGHGIIELNARVLWLAQETWEAAAMVEVEELEGE